MDNTTIRYSRVPFPHFTERHVAATTDNIHQLERVTLEVAVELGDAHLPLNDLLNLRPAPEGVDLNELSEEEQKKHIVKLDRQIGEPVNILVNGRILAHGEVVSTTPGANYGIRIIAVLTEQQRIEAETGRFER